MNYNSMGRTNYFQVTDEARYNVLFESLYGEEKKDFTKEVDGKKLHGFGIVNGIDFYLPASENEEVKLCIEKGITLYDEFGDEIPVSDYDKQEELYTKEDKAVYRRFDTENGGYFDEFIEELQKILPDGEVFAYETIGNEGFRYFTGAACVVTNKEVEWLDMDSFIAEIAKSKTGKTTSCSY